MEGAAERRGHRILPALRGALRAAVLPRFRAPRVEPDVICREYRCLFVHVPKTAGMSIEHVFLRLVGLTWETRAPLLLGGNDDPRLGPPRLEHLKASEY